MKLPAPALIAGMAFKANTWSYPMPLDQTGGARPPSAWTDYLARLKLARRARNRETLARRRVTQQRLALAEYLLGRIIDGADFLAEVSVEHEWGAMECVSLVVTLSAYDLKRLCEHGAAFEDFEPGGDDEPGEDDEPDDDDEESLVPAGDSHFRFKHLKDGAKIDGEVGDAAAEKVAAMRQRYRQYGGRPRGALIPTGDGELVGEEQANGLMRLRLRRAGR